MLTKGIPNVKKEISVNSGKLENRFLLVFGDVKSKEESEKWWKVNCP